MATELQKIGANVKEGKSSLIIRGFSKDLKGGSINCYGDHRIAMAFSIAGLMVPNIIIEDERCVNKSFTNFYRVFKKLGAKYVKT
jgi:3-phosphoshikimate 1-carboxyvinyltransferase